MPKTTMLGYIQETILNDPMNPLEMWQYYRFKNALI